MALSTCSMASVVTASLSFFQLLSTFYCIAKLPFQLLQVLFCDFFIWWCCSDAKYIFQSKGIGSSEYRTNIM
jgi:hypothetical protein